MISFSPLDIIVILLFFTVLLSVGFYSSRKTTSSSEDYLLSGRNLSLFLFVLTTVSTWYGGIIGVGEFTYRYGLLSWFTQGLPYYFFAFLFAIFFAKKIRNAFLFTIPDKIEIEYGKTAGIISSIIVFILVTPAPYLLMTANLLVLSFDIDIVPALIISLFLSISYLIKGGFRSNVYADAFQFFVMFGGFIIIFVVSLINYGGLEFIDSNVPETHMNVTGGASPGFIIVWFLIAMWTFADPGFHQRSFAAKSGSIAVKGILISIGFWVLFDFLTTATGLYAKAVLPDLDQPIWAFPLLAEKVLAPGLKGIFYAALFATILSTLNSFFFLSATTISRDLIYKIKNDKKDVNLKKYTVLGLFISGILSSLIAYSIPSVVEIWYTIGSLFIPGIILPVISAYYPEIQVSKKIILLEMIMAVLGSTLWFFLRTEIVVNIYFVNEIEPMIVGLVLSLIIHTFGLIIYKK
ncbi:MAG TPA: sodium:solute symporter family protein [Ignavibacteriaceae bacterium]|nr:sodium:solute symporter family protein [Ignavibacteriaceae bacterium]